MVRNAPKQASRIFPLTIALQTERSRSVVEFIIYATKTDADTIREWINNDPDVAWVCKISERDRCYRWKASSSLGVLQEQEYAIWNLKSGPLTIPSAHTNIQDDLIDDPFEGWDQTLSESHKTSPWFGGNLPGPYSFRFAEAGREAPGSLGRSGFSWLADRYKSIGKPARPEAKRWWRRLERFLEQSTKQIPWMPPSAGKRPIKAFVFTEAAAQLRDGRPRDINPL